VPRRWAFVAATTAGVDIGEIPAQQRAVAWRLDGPAEASISLSGRSRLASQIIELETDLVVYLDGVKVFRGRLAPSTEEVTPEAHTLQVSAVDYRGMLERRLVYDADVRVFSQVDQSTIAWTLVAASQARSGGNLGITRGIGQSTTVLRDRTIDAGKTVGEEIVQLAQLASGFEWTVDADLAFNVYYPLRGEDKGVILDYGGTVSKLRRTFTPAEFANAIRATGAPALATEERATAGIATDPAGRFESQFGFSSVLEASTLGAKADFLIAEHSIKRPAFSVDLRPGGWGGPSSLFVGDTARLVVRSGRLNVNSLQRVVTLGVALTASGAEQITATLGRPDPLDDVRRRTLSTEQRLKNLENE